MTILAKEVLWVSPNPSCIQSSLSVHSWEDWENWEDWEDDFPAASEVNAAYSTDLTTHSSTQWLYDAVSSCWGKYCRRERLRLFWSLLEWRNENSLSFVSTSHLSCNSPTQIHFNKQSSIISAKKEHNKRDEHIFLYSSLEKWASFNSVRNLGDKKDNWNASVSTYFFKPNHGNVRQIKDWQTFSLLSSMDISSIHSRGLKFLTERRSDERRINWKKNKEKESLFLIWSSRLLFLSK